MKTDKKICNFIKNLLENKINVTSSEIEAFLKKKGHDVSSRTIAAIKANITRRAQ